MSLRQPQHLQQPADQAGQLHVLQGMIAGDLADAECHSVVLRLCPTHVMRFLLLRARVAHGLLLDGGSAWQYVHPMF